MYKMTVKYWEIVNWFEPFTEKPLRLKRSVREELDTKYGFITYAFELKNGKRGEHITLAFESEDQALYARLSING